MDCSSIEKSLERARAALLSMEPLVLLDGSSFKRERKFSNERATTKEQ